MSLEMSKQSKTMSGHRPLSPEINEGAGMSLNEIKGLKKAVDRGAARFWAKQGMTDPGLDTGYNYGSKAGKPKKTG